MMQSQHYYQQLYAGCLTPKRESSPRPSAQDYEQRCMLHNLNVALGLPSNLPPPVFSQYSKTFNRSSKRVAATDRYRKIPAEPEHTQYFETFNKISERVTEPEHSQYFKTFNGSEEQFQQLYAENHQNFQQVTSDPQPTTVPSVNVEPKPVTKSERDLKRAAYQKMRYNNMTPEQKLQYSRKRSDRQREKRLEEVELLSKPIDEMTPEIRAKAEKVIARKTKRAEYEKAKYSNMSAEQRRERNRKKEMYRKVRKERNNSLGSSEYTDYSSQGSSPTSHFGYYGYFQ